MFHMKGSEGGGRRLNWTAARTREYTGTCLRVTEAGHVPVLAGLKPGVRQSLSSFGRTAHQPSKYAAYFVGDNHFVGAVGEGFLLCSNRQELPSAARSASRNAPGWSRGGSSAQSSIFQHSGGHASQ